MTLSFASTDIYVEEEKLIYPLESLVGRHFIIQIIIWSLYHHSNNYNHFTTFQSNYNHFTTIQNNYNHQVSEIGGALGLFLGFSFLGIFETVSNFFLKLTSMLKIKP